MPIAIIELAGKIGLYFLEYFMRKSAADDAARRDYIQFLEIMSRRGLTTFQARLDANGQIERVKDLWKKSK